MADLISHLTIYGLYAATLALLFVLLFVHEPRGRLVRLGVLAIGALALGLPIWLTGTSLGYPDRWPDDGKFRLLGWHVSEGDQAIFVFVDQSEDEPPRLLRVPFSREAALKLQNAAAHFGTYREMSIAIAEGSRPSEPTYTLTFKKVFGDD